MKILKHDIFSMSNISSKRTGLGCEIWVDDLGSSRNLKHSIPRVKLTYDDYEVSVSISEKPEILAQSKNIPHSVMKKFKEGIEYTARNHDILEKYNNIAGPEYDTQDMFDDLRSRGQFI